jgi:hypothetical protein
MADPAGKQQQAEDMQQVPRGVLHLQCDEQDSASGTYSMKLAWMRIARSSAGSPPLPSETRLS